MSDDSTNGDDSTDGATGASGGSTSPDDTSPTTPRRREPSADALRKAAPRRPARPTGPPPARASGPPPINPRTAAAASAAVGAGATADAAGSKGAGAGDGGDEPPTGPTPVDDEADGPNRVLVGLGIAAAVILIVGLIAVLLQTGSDDGRDGDAIETASRVTIRDSPTTTEATTTTTEPETTTTSTTEPETTTTTGSPDTTGPAVTTTVPRPTSTRPPVTEAPTPAELTVTYGGGSDGRMFLTEGASSVIIINNVGGSPGGYNVAASGEVEVEGAADGVIEPGAIVTVTVVAGAAVGDPPHGTLTVTGAAGVIVSIDVIIT